MDRREISALIRMGLKWCNGCTSIFALEDFHHKGSGHQSYCKRCQIAAVQRTADPVRIKAYHQHLTPERKAQRALQQRTRYWNDPVFRAKKLAAMRKMYHLNPGRRRVR